MIGLAQAIFAAGCFWGVQSTFDKVSGVEKTQVGYIGGMAENPTYKMVSNGNTNYAEAIEITYNPEMVSYEALLDIFFKSHNPTTMNRQGPDVGTQYRSAIFYLDEGQKQTAIDKINQLNQDRVFDQKIVTKLEPATKFYPAEEYHQKYLEKQGKSSCSVQPPKIDKEKLKEKLSPEQYNVLINKATEKPFTGKYLNNKAAGTYNCGVCGNPIFQSDNKFDSGSGWPSFDKAIPNSTELKKDLSFGMVRTEVVCAKCGAHLGHLFEDGPTQTKERFCINSVSLDFDKKD